MWILNCKCDIEILVVRLCDGCALSINKELKNHISFRIHSAIILVARCVQRYCVAPRIQYIIMLLATTLNRRDALLSTGPLRAVKD